MQSIGSAFLARGFSDESQIIAECISLLPHSTVTYSSNLLAESLIAQRQWSAAEKAGSLSIRLNAARLRYLQDQALLPTAKTAKINLEELLASCKQNLQDSIDFYSYALAARAIGQNLEFVKSALITAVEKDPSNLPAAIALRELGHICCTGDLSVLVSALGASDSFETVSTCEIVLKSVPEIRCIRLRLGQALYRLNEFQKAEVELKRAIYDGQGLLSVSGADMLSDALFLRKDVTALAALAADCFTADRYAPETCIVLANHYQLQALQQTGGNFREKAVLALQKAVQIRPEYAAGWLLLGHAYLELRNLPAAIHSYSRATSDPRSKPALANAYTLLGQHTFAEYYRGN